MKKVILFVVWILPIFSCVKTDFVNDRVDPKIFISNPLLELKKNGAKISELPYTHPRDLEGMSKTAPNIIRFFKLGFDYIVRILITRIRKN